MTAVAPPALEHFRSQARAWLAAHAQPRGSAQVRGSGSDNVAVFHDLSDEAELDLLARLAAWQQLKIDGGFGALSWPAEFGGRGLDPGYEDVFSEEEARFETPAHHELVSVTLHLIAPTLRLLGSPELRDRLLMPLLRAEQLCCQLFSEPGAGSDLAGLATRAVRDGDEWVINGQKVWSSGARFAQWGELIARNDPDVPKHAGMTAFLLPMDTPGVEVRPLRQMSGGRSFCEVFLTNVRIPDSLRIGEVGGGWQVALTTLGFERGNSSNTADVGGNFAGLLELARWLGKADDPAVRTDLAWVYAHEFLATVANQRDQQARQSGEPLGPVGSMRKLQWVAKLTLISEVASRLLGPRLAADSGEWGTFAWTEHVLGAPGYRIAGGSDEVQRNIIAERMLGLPQETRYDKGIAWRDIPR